MPASIRKKSQSCGEGEALLQAVELLSQQVWCWGCDIRRPEENWLLEIGFERIETPDDRRETCSSVYTLELPKQQRVVLRGFGVFFGDNHLGGVFLPRYTFQPKYTTEATLNCPPWSDEDLPKFSKPNDQQRDNIRSLTLKLIDWIESYETTITERLGIEYRRSTLIKWDNGKRLITQAEKIASSWRQLSHQIANSQNVF